MEGFKLTPEKMREVATTFSTNAEEIMDTATRVNNAAEELMNAWVGAGADEFLNDITEYKLACDKMVNLLEERSNALMSSAQAAEDLSNSLAHQLA